MISNQRSILTIAAIGFISAIASTGAAAVINLTDVTISSFPNPIGIDYHEPSDTVVMSVNYPSGQPNNFAQVDGDGNVSGFSAINGLTNEVKIATVRSGNSGGFTTGDLFTGNGVDGQIARIGAGGATIVNPWVDLPGVGNGLMRGSLYIDRTGVFGGDLIAVTTSGQVWRVDSSGNPTLVADVNVHLEGVITVPNDVATYGPLAGKIIAGAEGVGALYTFDTNGNIATHNVGVNIEDIDLIVPNENFYGVNYGSSRLLGAPASEFAPFVGDILLTQEYPSGTGLYALSWNGATLNAEQFTLGAGSAVPAQWEHVTFAPLGITTIPPPEAPEPGTILLLGLGLGIGVLRRRSV